MSIYYQTEVLITTQEDGLWRLYVPGLDGAWVDTKSIEDGFTELQGAIALAISYYRDHALPLPTSISVREGQPVKANLPIIMEEYKIVTAEERAASRRRKK